MCRYNAASNFTLARLFVLLNFPEAERETARSLRMTIFFSQPYLNGGTPNSSWEMPSMKSAIFVSGPVNNASVPGDLIAV